MILSELKLLISDLRPYWRLNDKTLKTNKSYFNKMSAYKESFNDLYVSREHFYMVTARVFFKNPEIPSLCKFLL